MGALRFTLTTGETVSKSDVDDPNLELTRLMRGDRLPWRHGQWLEVDDKALIRTSAVVRIDPREAEYRSAGFS